MSTVKKLYIIHYEDKDRTGRLLYSGVDEADVAQQFHKYRPNGKIVRIELETSLNPK